MQERVYQAKLRKKIERMFPGCYILKNDSGLMPGVPDLLVLYNDRWAMLEVKAKQPTGPRDFEPNQEWYIAEFDNLSFGACIYPANEERVLDDLSKAFGIRREARLS